MPRFVLLYHECPPSYEHPSHWDLMLEAGEALRTWALLQLPSAWHEVHAATTALHANCPLPSRENVVPAEQLADHRLTYLEYEGPVSGKRGCVKRIDAGTFVIKIETSGRLDAELVGNFLRGALSLNRTLPRVSDWQLSWLA